MSQDNAQSQQRKQKLALLREQGRVYPNDFRPTASATELQDQFVDHDAISLKEISCFARLAGRLMSRRRMGKVTFVDLQDASGRIQLFIRQATVSKQEYEKFLEYDIGDIIGVDGTVFRTRTGELSIAVETVIFAG